MKFSNVNEVNDFLKAIKECKGEVWLESVYGDKFNLKSELSVYVALAALLTNRGSDLELFCSLPSDEHYLIDFFNKHPKTI